MEFWLCSVDGSSTGVARHVNIHQGAKCGAGQGQQGLTVQLCSKKWLKKTGSQIISSPVTI